MGAAPAQPFPRPIPWPTAAWDSPEMHPERGRGWEEGVKGRDELLQPFLSWISRKLLSSRGGSGSAQRDTRGSQLRPSQTLLNHPLLE